MRIRSGCLCIGYSKTVNSGPKRDCSACSPLSFLIILQSLLQIPGVFSLQTTKSSSLGGQQVLDCSLHYPNNVPVEHIVEWRQDGLEDPVYMQYNSYPANVHPLFENRVRLVNNISLEISHIRESDEGWYECTVIYVDGVANENEKSNGTWIYLNVHIPPKIVDSSPKSFHQPLGSTVRIFCDAEGSPRPTVSWTRDGQPVSPTRRLSIQGDGSEIVISDLQENDGGIFKCTFSNPVGLITQTIHLIVEGQAYIIGQPSNKTAVLGQRIAFNCQAKGYPANITYRWYKDSYQQNVNELDGYGDRIEIIDSTGSLVIKVVKKLDMGWYFCRPSNGVGNDPEAAAFLNVTYAPTILKELIKRDQIWALGFQARLDCPVDANPPVTSIVWMKDGIRVNAQDSHMLSQLTNGSLVIAQARMSDTGNYRCTAISSYGREASQVIQVEVKDPPRFTVTPKEQYVSQPAQTVDMPCAARGTPRPDITWRKERGKLEYDGRVKLQGGNLTIQGLQKSDHGVYVCEASNEVAKIVASTELIVQNTTPHAPYNVSVDAHLFSATVRWIRAYSSYPQHYVLWFRTVVNSLPGTWQTMRVEPANTTRFTVYNLEPDTTYEFKVLSRNQLGDGQFSSVVTAKTSGYVSGIATALPTDSSGSTYIPPVVRPIGPKPASPINVSASGHEKGIIISWVSPENSTVPVFSYAIEYRTTDSWQPVSKNVRMPTTTFLFTPVHAGTTYHFRVYSYGVLSYSLPSREVSYTVPEGDDGFRLSNTEIGGIIGGLLFLVVAVSLAVVAVLCSRRRGRKQPTKYDNVKYLGPADDMDGTRPEFAPEWSAGFQNGGADAVRGRDLSVATDNRIFMVPQSGDVYAGYQNGAYKRGQDSRFYDRDHSLYDPDDGRSVRRRSKSHDGRPRSQDRSSRASDKNQSFGRSERSLPYEDENGFQDDNGFLPRRSRSSDPPRRSRRYDSGQSTKPADQSSRHSMRDQGQTGGHPDFSFHDNSFHPQSFQDTPVELPTSSQYSLHTPIVSPVPQGQGYGRPYLSYLGDDDEEEEVFMPPPVSSILPQKPGFPRHSSMKPAQQTYLTDDLVDTSGRSFLPSDLSSVLPLSYSDLPPGPYQPYQRQYPDSSQTLPSGTSMLDRYGNDRRFSDTGHSSFADTLDNTVIPSQTGQGQGQSMSRTLSARESNSSDSSGRPVNYTRDQLQGAVEKARKGPRARKSGRRGSGSELDSISESPVTRGFGPSQSGPYTGDGGHRPTLTVLDRPSRGSYRSDLEPYKVGDSRTSMSSSGLGSNGGRGRATDSRSHVRDDLTPDSISSGIGSRNTSSQLTGSSLHSRPSRINASESSFMTPQDWSQESSPFPNYPHAQRSRDISGDENYEFDSVKDVESDLLEALRNYSEVNSGSEQLLSALESGLNASKFYNELYPKPRRQSRYSDSEQRFEKLRGEFQQYRQKQQARLSQSHAGPSDSSTYSSSRNSDYMPRYRTGLDSVGYPIGPMDSDML